MSVEVIEGEVVERGLVTVPDEGLTGAGTFALAAMSDADFDDRLAALVKHRKRVAQIQRALMKPNVHYGVIPGTDKPTLYQPGAELLCDIYRLRARLVVHRIVGDGEATPHLSYQTECYLHLGSLDGPVVAHASGTANSWEKRYRYRQAERVCPNCQKPAVIKGKAEYGGGWLCWPKKDGCNSKWAAGDKAIEGQEVGQVDNPDPFDLDVVLDAMAAKRAFVHATRRGCAVSDLFTSDIEDLPGFEPPREDAPTAPRTARSAPKPADVQHAATEEGYTGKAEIGTSNADYELRQTPDGMSVAFRLVVPREGKSAKKYKVVALDPLASSLAVIRSDVIGHEVTVWGRVRDEQFIPKDTITDERPNGRAITYSVLDLERIATADWALPAPRSVSPDDNPFTPEEQGRIDAAIGAA